MRTPLVGRRRELDSLLDAFERARGARSVQLVTLVGEPRIGKSRLVYELFEAVVPGTRRCLFVQRELHEWLDGATLEVVELPNDGRMVRIAEPQT
ncbi:MAG: ATP-binding protein [Gaiellaceae bacterium]